MKEEQQKQVSKKYVLFVIAALSMTFAASGVAVEMIYQDIIELDSDDNLENSTNDKDPIISLIEHIIYLMIFLGFFVFWLKKYLKVKKTITYSKREIKKTETKQEFQIQQNPKKSIFLYVILIPTIHAVIIMFSGNIIHIFKDPSDVVYMDLQNVVITPALLLWWISGRQYLWVWKKIPTSDYFKIFSHNNIILERGILKKVIIGVFIAFAILLTIVLITANSVHDSEEMQLWELFSFAIFFNLIIIVLFSFTKLLEQNAKKDFHLYMASGFCKKAIKEKNDEIKRNHMRDALVSYNNFFNRNHKKNNLDDIEKINIAILSQKFNTNSFIDILSMAFESGNSYLPLEKIAVLMKVKIKEDLLKNNSIFERIRYWSGIVGPVLGAIAGAGITYLLTKIIF